MKKKFDIRMTGHHKLAGVLFSGLIFLAPNAFAEKVKKPNLPKSYASKAAPAEINDSDRTFIELREAAKKNDVFRAQQLASSLPNYPYDDYVAYFRIKPQLFDSAGGAISRGLWPVVSHRSLSSRRKSSIVAWCHDQLKL